MIVARGIVGADTRIAAGGDVHCGFVQNSEIVAAGDIFVGRYLLNAQVRAGKRLVVRGGDDGGSICGASSSVRRAPSAGPSCACCGSCARPAASVTLARRRRSRLESKFTRRIHAGRIRVRHTAHADVAVFFGPRQLVLDQDYGAVTFQLHGDRVAAQPGAEPV